MSVQELAQVRVDKNETRDENDLVDVDTKQEEIEPTYRTPQKPTPAGHVELRVDNGMIEETPKEFDCMMCCRNAFWNYTWPLRNFGYSMGCTMFHILNYTFMWLLFSYIVFDISFSLGMLSACCVGIVCFYVCSEFAIIFANFDLALTYYMIEDNPELIKRHGPTLGYATRHLPPCTQLTDRVKAVMLDLQTYKIIIYGLLFKPILVHFTSAVFLLVCVDLFGMIVWVLFLVYRWWFERGYVCWGTPHTVSGRNVCDGWLINSLGDTLVFLALSIVLLPAVLYVQVYAAKLSKFATYFFLTNEYSRNKSEDETLLIKPKGHQQTLSPAATATTSSTVPVVSSQPVHTAGGSYGVEDDL